MKKEEELSLDLLKGAMDSNKHVKTAVYVGSAIVLLMLLGKVSSGLASSVRGMNDLRSALNGN